QIALGIHLRGLVQSVDGRIEILRLYGLVGSLEFFIQGLNRGHFLGLFLLCLLHLLQLFLANALLLGSLGLRLLLIEIEGVLIYFHAVAIDRVQLLAILQQRDLYFPGSIPREKYSPFLLVFSVYLRPLSVLYHSTVAPAMGLPCISLATPLTVPVAWAKAVGMQCRQHSDQYQHHRMLLHVLASKRLSIARFSIDDSFESMRKQIE